MELGDRADEVLIDASGELLNDCVEVCETDIELDPLFMVVGV